MKKKKSREKWTVKWEKKPIQWVKCPYCDKEFAVGLITFKFPSPK